MPTYALYLADLVRGRSASHGITNTALELARALPCALESDERLELHLNRSLVDELGGIPGDERTEVTVHADPRRRLGRFVAVQLGAPRAGLSADVVHLHGSMAPFLGVPGSRLVTTIHDDMPLRYLDGTLAPPGRSPFRPYSRFVCRRALAASDAVITVSRFMADELAMAARAQGFEPPPIHVVSPAPTLPLGDVLPLERREPVIVHLASTYPHKRTAEAVRWTVDHLERSRPDLSLLMLGTVPEEVADLLDHPRVRHEPGTLSQQEVASVLARSRVLVFTSGYEGFGLPPIEAYALGTPATWARADSVVEAVGDVPGGHPVGDEGAFHAALDDVLRLGIDRLRALSVRFRRRTWRDVAAETLEVYRSLG